MSIPERKDVATENTWDLAKLFPDDAAWEQGLKKLSDLVEGIGAYKGTLGKSPKHMYSCLEYMTALEELEERVGYYAHLKTAEDMGNSANMDRWGRYISLAAKASAAASYINPEILQIPEDKLKAFIDDPVLKDYKRSLEKLVRFKPHVLTEAEEKLMSLQTEANETARKAFSSLTDVDLDFGTIDTPEGPKPLSQSSFSSFLIHQNRELRKTAYNRFYTEFEKHKHTLSSLYAGSVQLDVYKAKARNYPSARAMALFPDKVPESVYENLIETVHSFLPSLHKYYSLRKKLLGVDSLRHYDVYVPLVSSVQTRYSYEEAVELIMPALSPLGEEYCTVLREGLLGRWVDRYENKGKRSGAFSAGSYNGDPYILMNYKEDVLRDIFTLAHEGGHSMHSWYSVKNNRFQDYNYTIFEAEVASTFNEQLLADHLIKNAESDEMKAYLTGKLADDTIATIFRQTMFAEYESICHSLVESGTPLTVDNLRSHYRQLQESYFGPEMELSDTSDLEGLRIPHFYRAFYVYKYATGLSASIALSNRVLKGGAAEKEAYLGFLKSGGSKYPLESLKTAGVDMSSPGPIKEALKKFEQSIAELEKLLLE